MSGSKAKDFMFVAVGVSALAAVAQLYVKPASGDYSAGVAPVGITAVTRTMDNIHAYVMFEDGRIFVKRVRDYSDYDWHLLGDHPDATSGADEPNADDWTALQASPNPFGSTVELTLHAGEHMRDATARVYDVEGRVVRTIELGDLQPGELRTSWDGRDDGGTKLPAGVYFYHLTHQDGIGPKEKLVLMK